MLNIKTLACAAAIFVPAALADDWADNSGKTTTITIPALASSAVTSTLSGCGGTTTVVVATPMVTACGGYSSAAAPTPAATSSAAPYSAPAADPPKNNNYGASTPAPADPPKSNGYGGDAPAPADPPKPNSYGGDAPAPADPPKAAGYGGSAPAPADPPKPAYSSASSAAAAPATSAAAGWADPTPAAADPPKANGYGYGGNAAATTESPKAYGNGGYATGAVTAVPNNNGGYAPAVAATPVASAPATPKGACPVKPACAPQGFDIDYYFNPIGGYTKWDSGFESNYYIVDKLSPLKSSQTNETFFAQDNTFTNSNGPAIRPNSSVDFDYMPGYTRVVNGGITVDGNNFTLVYSGLYKAPVTGTYQLCSSADNGNEIYFGDGNAFDCATGKPGTAANKLSRSAGGNFINPSACVSVDMVQGAFYPVRNVMGNWGAFSAFNFTITLPNGGASSNKFEGSAFPHTCITGL